MDNNKIIIGVLIAVIIALLIGIVAVMGDFTKPDSQLTIIADSSLTQGDALVVKLSDSNENPLANQTVNITLTDSDNQKSYSSVVTGDDGTGKLKIDENPGEYDVAVSYGGSDKYNPSNAAKKITVNEKAEEVLTGTHAVSQESSSSDTDSGAFYSKQAERVIHTGDVMDSPGGKMRHLGNNKWEPVE